MKKILIVGTAVLAAIFMVQSVSAGIAGSAHDFTATGGTPLGADNLCVTCHTPHRPKLNVPLWAHDLTQSTFNLYNTNAAYSGNNTAAYDASPTALNGSRSRLCLSCHDGTVAVAGTTFIPQTDDHYIPFDNGAPVNAGVGSNGLRGNHPVGVDYSQVKANQPSDFNDISADLDVKLENNKVQCTSCHNPHNKVVGTKMLVKNNSGGTALCITCHVK